MSTFRLRIDHPFPPELAGGAVAIGNFDGVHRGHAQLVSELVDEARQVGGPAIALTFDPHPLRLLAPERFLPQLTTPDDRAAYLQDAGADHVILLETTPGLLGLHAEAFLELLLRDRLQARAVVEGFNFAFGKGRGGSIQLLRDWCRSNGIRGRIVDPVTESHGEPVSSSRVRNALNAGDVAEARSLLGRPYRLRGTVVAGDHRGQSLGFPTANLADCASLIPGDGVYAVRSGKHAGAANVGGNPTFGQADRKVEIHLIDFQGDLYGKPLAVDFLARIRDTQRFDSRELLMKQLAEDVARARDLELQDRLEDVLRREVGPALEIDGGAVEVLGIENGVARVRLGAVCASCPATIMTLVTGIEQELKKHLPEIEYLEAAP
ncbi:MAG: bifunctional riboflavin kinase/FAD synthetase [Gemmataceae bacterium]|nr:bifunctional riboflavin kinase/FAD synthetase [Gemmataceae bacterium]